MVDNFDKLDSSGPLFNLRHMPRPRVDKLIDRAARGQLVYVLAGTGYGKTQAVRHYIETQEHCFVRWLQLTENDNIGSRYWENLTHNISHDHPNLAGRLREFGFPETSARFKQFAVILKEMEHRSKKTFIVLDDFHLINSEQALTFAERFAYVDIPGTCLIIISRKEPEINVVSLFAKGQVNVITEDDLRFTSDEISDFLRGRDIVFPAKNLPQISEATKGWVLAVLFLSLILKKSSSSLDFALEAMKHNIFKLMETEAFDDFPEDTKKTMVKLSLVSDRPTMISPKFIDDAAFLHETPELAAFVWFDSFTGEYRVHPLYWEFLQNKHFILSDDEIQDTYRRAADWCSQNNFSLDAVYYYAKLKDFGKMVEKFLSFPFKLPHDTCEYFVSILEGLNLDGEDQSDVSVLLLKYLFMPLLLMGVGRFEEAKKLNYDVIQKWENSDKPISVNLIYSAYTSLIYINIHTCTSTCEYNVEEYLKKAAAHLKNSHIPPLKISGSFAVPDLRSFACLLGEKADLPEIGRFHEMVKQTVMHIAETNDYRYYGYDDLLSCELAFFRNQTDTARNHAHTAILKAREKKQYNVEMMAAGYMLRIAVCEGDGALAKKILTQMADHLNNPDFWNRQLLYDLFTGFFYIQIGIPQMASPQLLTDEREAPTEVHIPAGELIVSVKNYIALDKYNQALVVLSNSYPREPNERFLLGELTLSLLSAVVRAKTGDLSGALKDFERAYSLSFEGELEMPFVELGKNLHPLAVAALKQANFGIPGPWLKTIDRKASIYAKKAAFVAASFRREKNTKDSVLFSLSNRELEVLNDLYHGLSRDEIAAHRYLSINTVKKVLQSIYLKLDANTSVDAIRIALEKKLIE
ncbi:MAG: LuxR C-terminal-related transcriptional regulator [Oscillospiraceae bacterium]|nr:LuxR C-terminal-related transcriptional regulator [Oscillospiraceae bacterium]